MKIVKGLKFIALGLEWEVDHVDPQLMRVSAGAKVPKVEAPCPPPPAPCPPKRRGCDGSCGNDWCAAFDPPPPRPVVCCCEDGACRRCRP